MSEHSAGNGKPVRKNKTNSASSEVSRYRTYCHDAYEHPAGNGKPVRKTPEELEKMRVEKSKNVKKAIGSRLLSLLVIAGITGGVVACTKEMATINDEEFYQDPMLNKLSEDEYNAPSKLYKYAVRNGEAAKLYKSDYIYFIYDKDDYNCEEYLSNTRLNGTVVIYDLETEELLAYKEIIGPTEINWKYFDKLIDENYEVHLTDASDYVEGYKVKEYYTLDEIKTLEQEIGEGVKILSKVK